MPRPPAPCGTEAAYRRHKRKGEDVDDACQRAQAAARAERRSKTPRQDETMADVAAGLFGTAVQLFGRGPDAPTLPTLDPAVEYPRLYLILDAALPRAMPREASSIVREMRGLLQEMAKTAPPAQEKTLAEQLEEARRDRERRRAERDAERAEDRSAAPAG